MSKSKGQQRDLSSLIARKVESLERTAQEDKTALIQSVPLTAIHPCQNQPRHYFDNQKLDQLIASVKQHGILEPLLIRPLKDDKYELVAGERRYRAAQEVGLIEVPTIVRTLTDKEALQLALEENLQREDLNPFEEVEGILQLIELELNISQEEVTSLLYKLDREMSGKTAHNVMGTSNAKVIQEIFTALGQQLNSFVKNQLPLLKLPEDIKLILRQGKLAYTKARAIARLKNEDARQTLLNEALEKKLSLNQIKERGKELTLPQGKAEEPSPQQKCKTIFEKVANSKAWDDPEKRKRIEKLLAELEGLVE